MMEEIGIITAVERRNSLQYIWVETQIKSTCGGCQANDECGTGIVAKAFSPKKEQLSLPCEQTAKVGQEVKLGIPEDRLLSASALVYLLPLVAMLCTALATQYSLPLLGLQAEGWIIASAIIAAALSFYWLSYYFKQAKQADYQPQLISLLPWHGDKIKFVSVAVSQINNQDRL
jgi:sigma-E factor negative regulatory protein RseC